MDGTGKGSRNRSRSWWSGGRSRNWNVRAGAGAAMVVGMMKSAAVATVMQGGGAVAALAADVKHVAAEAGAGVARS